MTELSVADVETYTNGRLDAGDAEVARMLAAALQVARREAQWHVSPVRAAVSMTLDGPDSRILFLPTMKVTTLTTLVEDGVTLDVATIKVSAGDGAYMRRRTALRKPAGGWWSCEYGAIELTMSHGFTEDEAADWRQAILSMVDQMSLLPVKASTGTSAFGVKSERIDDVYMTYDTYAAMADEVLFSVAHVIDGYRLPPVEFL